MDFSVDDTTAELTTLLRARVEEELRSDPAALRCRSRAAGLSSKTSPSRSAKIPMLASARIRR